MDNLKALDAIVRTRLGDWASVVGVFIALIGFTVTVWNTRRSKAAAEQARAIVVKLREDSERMDFVAECAAAIGFMNQIKTFHRQDSHVQLLHNYPLLRSKLIAVKRFPGLTDHQRSDIQKFLASISRMEDAVEKAQHSGKPLADVARYNKNIAEQTDLLQDVMASLKAGLAE